MSAPVTMPYRDDRDTLKLRVEELEAELSDARREIEQRDDLNERLLRLDAELARTKSELAELGAPKLTRSVAPVADPRAIERMPERGDWLPTRITGIGAGIGFVAACIAAQTVNPRFGVWYGYWLVIVAAFAVPALIGWLLDRQAARAGRRPRSILPPADDRRNGDPRD